MFEVSESGSVGILPIFLLATSSGIVGMVVEGVCVAVAAVGIVGAGEIDSMGTALEKCCVLPAALEGLMLSSSSSSRSLLMSSP